MQNLINELRTVNSNLSTMRAANTLEKLAALQQADLQGRLSAEAKLGFEVISPTLEECIKEYREVMNADT